MQLCCRDIPSWTTAGCGQVADHYNQMHERLNRDMHICSKNVPGRRPAASCQVAAVVLGGHDGRLQILIPDARCPVTDGQEVLGVEGISHQAINRTMMTCQACIIDISTFPWR